MFKCYNPLRVNKSDAQCRQLESLGFLVKMKLLRGYGGAHNSIGNSRGVSYFLVQKIGNPGEEGALIQNSLWDTETFLKPHNDT